MVVKFFGESGQAISIDAVIAITIFMVIFAAIVTIWENQNVGEERELILQDMKENGERTLNYLVRSTGEKSYDTTNLVGYWKFDAQEDDYNTIRAFDYSGNNNHGQYYNGADNNAQGKWDNNAGFFDGANDYIEVAAGTTSKLSPTNQITISAWIYRKTDSGGFERIVSKSSSTNYRYWYQILNTDYFEFGVQAANYLSDTTTPITTNRWYHIVGTYASDGGSNNMRIYIDGSLKAQATKIVSIDTGAEPLNIGRLGAGSNWYYGFNGYIEELKIYDRALTADEILQEYNGSAPTTKKTDWETTIDSACSNWPGADNLKFVGLAKRDRVLEPEKIAAFAKCADWAQSQSKYEKMKAKMLLAYDFYFRFLDKAGNIIEEPLGTKMVSGKNPNTTNPYAIIILKRAVNYEGTNYNGEAIAELAIFKQK